MGANSHEAAGESTVQPPVIHNVLGVALRRVVHDHLPVRLPQLRHPVPEDAVERPGYHLLLQKRRIDLVGVTALRAPAQHPADEHGVGAGVRVPGFHHVAILVSLGDPLGEVQPVPIQGSALRSVLTLPSGSRPGKRDLEVGAADVHAVPWACAMEKEPLVAALDQRRVLQQDLQRLYVEDGLEGRSRLARALLGDRPPVYGVVRPELRVHVPHHSDHPVPGGHLALVLERARRVGRVAAAPVEAATAVAGPVVVRLVRGVEQPLERLHRLAPELDQHRVAQARPFRPVSGSRGHVRCQHVPILGLAAPGMHGPLVATGAQPHP
mmetsp:Transcript_26084/g.73718  ORF Transcript_26084/g.73718 Transcript_26084/m.73718 type:complete len:324 (-) Transcript_26084:794-1765(-)